MSKSATNTFLSLMPSAILDRGRILSLTADRRIAGSLREDTADSTDFHRRVLEEGKQVGDNKVNDRNKTKPGSKHILNKKKFFLFLTAKLKFLSPLVQVSHKHRVYLLVISYFNHASCFITHKLCGYLTSKPFAVCKVAWVKQIQLIF